MIRIRTIQLHNNRHIIIIRRPRSWNAPHMVKDNYKYMLRTNGNKIPIGTSELKDYFLVAIIMLRNMINSA